MRPVVGFLALVLVAGASGALSAQPTGIRTCDEYYAMASACLPRMCEVERAIAEAELSFSRETLQKLIEVKGAAAATQACTQDVLDTIKDDPYGCYESARAKAGLPKPVLHDLKVQPAESSVTISFTPASSAAGSGDWEVALLSEDLEPQVRYTVSRSPAGFVLNTAVDTPSAAPQPFRLEPGLSYCFAISSPGGHVRRGHFTTSSR